MFTCLCVVHGGALKLIDRGAFDLALAEFADGEEVELTIDAVGQRHTRAQEKFFHGPVLKAFAELGYRKQEAKDMLALMFIPKEVRQMDGSVVLVPGHTSQLTKSEYTAFVEQCIQLAAENGIVVEDSDQWRQHHRSAA